MLITPTPIGDMRYKMSVLKRTATEQNELGEDVPTLQEIGNIWCKISPLTARELILADANNLDSTHKITCRYTNIFNHADTLQYQGTQFNIDEVIDIEHQHIELQILAHTET